ncbi:MAG: Unsaturated rhamnogalacturonyl hydrolase YteR [Verrucomicrobiota bacterium]|jgi:rhamnogalacturonyl hydrolase YesR
MTHHHPHTVIRSIHRLCAVMMAAIPLALSSSSSAEDLAAAPITAALKRSADWQLANPSGTEIRDWIIAPLYDGLLRTASATGDAKYLAAVLRMGTQSGWTSSNRIYHADDHAVGHAWLDVYQMNPSRKERLAPMRDRLSHVIAHPVTEPLAHGTKPKTKGVTVSDRWTWCDALYMAPPTLARLFTATGDRKYLQFLDREFQFTYDHLYDPAEKLFFRDATFFNKKTPNGSKTFWSRGNGWVYGGLCLTLEHLPPDHPKRAFYETLFKEMTTAILAAQQPDGLWHPSLLDPREIDAGETSGSGFFTFGLAWGVNHGLLDRAVHLPAITRAWTGLMTRVTPDGLVGYVQPVGAAPDHLEAGDTQDYGTGAFLMAGSEILRLLGATGADSKTLLAAAEKIVAEDLKPRAYVRLVPERKDDLAWENDKVAFRVYGPALRDGPEDSGIDAWCKRVARPVLDKWYFQDRTAGISYHKDHGEGLDAYHVSDTRGCGGLGLWIDHQLVTADTYQSAEIIWTVPEVAEFHTVYEYPVKVEGKPLFEHRVTRLRLGERLSEITSTFSTNPNQRFRNRKPGMKLPYEIAIGLNTQNKGASMTIDKDKGIIAVVEPLAGKSLGTGVLVDPSTVVITTRLPATDKEGKNEHALVIVRPDDQGRVTYRAGFAWAGAEEITDAAAWLRYLESQAAR